MAIILIVGGIRNGKTLLMVLLGILFGKDADIVFHNIKDYGPDPENKYYLHASNLMKLRGLILGYYVYLMDEAHLFIDSRMFKDNVDMTSFLEQTGKICVDIIMTGPALNRFDIRLRTIAEKVIYPKERKDGMIEFDIYVKDMKSTDAEAFRFSHTACFDPKPIMSQYSTHEQITKIDTEDPFVHDRAFLKEHFGIGE